MFRVEMNKSKQVHMKSRVTIKIFFKFNIRSQLGRERETDDKGSDKIKLNILFKTYLVPTTSIA